MFVTRRCSLLDGVRFTTSHNLEAVLVFVTRLCSFHNITYGRSIVHTSLARLRNFAEKTVGDLSGLWMLSVWGEERAATSRSHRQLKHFIYVYICVNICLLSNTFNSIVLSFKIYPYVSLYFIVGLRAIINN